MRIPPHQLYQVMTTFTRQLVDRIRRKTDASEIDMDASQGKITDHVRREAVLKQVTTEILSRITLLGTRQDGKADIRIHTETSDASLRSPQGESLVYDVLETDGRLSRKSLRLNRAEPVSGKEDLTP